MKKKTLKIPGKKEIVKTLNEFQPISKGKYFSITNDLNGLVPQKSFVNTTQMKNILENTQDADEIADQLLDSYKEKTRHERADAWGTVGPIRFSERYKGKKPGKEYDVFKRAFGIIVEIYNEPTISNAPLNDALQWMKSPNYLIYKFVEAASKGVDPFSIGLNEDDVKKTDEKLFVLCQVMDIFQKRIVKAKEDHDTLFLNTVRSIFKEDTRYYFDAKKGQGDKIHDGTVHKRWKMFLEYLKKPESMPSSFYARDKPTGLCFLAYSIHQIFSLPGMVKINQVEKKRAILKIELLMQKHGIFLEEITPLLTLMDRQQIESFLNKFKDI